MDEASFSFALRKMKKVRILRLKEILFELYAFERNKYEVAKSVGVTPQAIGPEIDLLENVDLLRKVRIEKRRGLPAYYYTLNLESAVESLKDLNQDEIDLLLECLNRFQPYYRELRALEQERKIIKIEGNIYEGIVPNDHKMFTLQFISSILIIGSLLSDLGSSLLPDFIKNNQQLFFILQDYSNTLREKLLTDSSELNKWLKENIKAISELYSKIWNFLMLSIVIASIIKEPSMKIMDKLEETKGDNLKKEVEKFRNYSKTKKKLNDFITEEGKIKNRCETNLKNMMLPLTEVQNMVINDEIIENKIDIIYQRLKLLSSRLQSSSLGLTSFDSEKERIEALKIRIAILSALNQQVNKFENELTKLRHSIIEKKFDDADSQIKSLISLTHNLEKLQKWHSDPHEFFEKTIEKSKIKKEEIDSKIQALVEEMKEEKAQLLSDFISQFNSNYPTINVSKKEIEDGIKRLNKKSVYPYIESIKLGKKREKIVRLDSTQKDQDEVIKIAQASPNGKVTIPIIKLQLNWPSYRAKIVLNDLVRNNKDVLFKHTRSEGDMWFIRGLKE
ncbi:MAG: hypothetical protein ACTSRG_05825 [Candidatus Helarchaeota archaeon]